MTTSNTLEHNELVRRAGRSAVMIVAAACAAAVLAGCGGGGSLTGAGTGGSAAGGGASQASLLTFCTNYQWATDSFNKASGDPTDPNFAQGMQTLLTAKQHVPTAISGAVNSMYSTLERVRKDPSQTVDVTALSEQIAVWVSGHCVAAASPTNSGPTSSRDGDAGTDGFGVPSDSSTVQALAANMCNQLLNTVNSVGVLDGVASDFSSSEPPALSQWQSSAASITAVAAGLASANAPQQLQVDVHTLATDVQDIIANGYSYPGVGDDVLTVKDDASQSACAAVTN